MVGIVAGGIKFKAIKKGYNYLQTLDIIVAYWHCAKTVGSVLGWFFPYLGTFFRENHPSIKPSYDTNRAGFLLTTPFCILHFWIVTKFSRISLKNGLGRGSETDRPSSKATNSEIVKVLIVPIYPFTTGGRYLNILWRLYGRKNHYPWIFWFAICSFLTFQTKARYEASLVMSLVVRSLYFILLILF